MLVLPVIDNCFVVDTFGINYSVAAMELRDPPTVIGQPSSEVIQLNWIHDHRNGSDAVMYLVALEEQLGPAIPVSAVCCQ